MGVKIVNCGGGRIKLDGVGNIEVEEEGGDKERETGDEGGDLLPRRERIEVVDEWDEEDDVRLESGCCCCCIIGWSCGSSFTVAGIEEDEGCIVVGEEGTDCAEGVGVGNGHLKKL